MRENRVPLIWILLIAGLFCIAAFDARAGGDRNNSESSSAASAKSASISSIGDVSNTSESILSAGDNISSQSSSVNVNGDKNRAYGLSLGDVDINDCYRSFQVTVLFQGSQLNYWCMADSLDAKGLHEAAALTRCKLDGYRKLFGDEDTCIAANTMTTLKILPENFNQSDDFKEDDEDYHEQLEAAVVALRAEFEALQAEKAKALARVAKAEKVAQRAAAAPQERYMDYEQRRQAAKDILEGKK